MHTTARTITCSSYSSYWYQEQEDGGPPEGEVERGTSTEEGAAITGAPQNEQISNYRV